MLIESSLITPENLRAAGFSEVQIEGKTQYRRREDIILFLENNVFEGTLTNGETFGSLAEQIVEVNMKSETAMDLMGLRPMD